MANALASIDSNFGGKPAAPMNAIVLDFTLDTYTTGGVDIKTILDANASWLALKLPSASIFSGFAALEPDAEGAKRIVEFLPDSQKIVLKSKGGGADLVEEANGAIGATVNVKLTALLA